jgi:ParB family chromosome partitioning protein
VAAPAKIEKKDEKGLVGEVPVAQVQPNPDQPRTNFKKEEIEELASSIKRDGLLQPILVRKKGDQYEIIAGERRWQACKSLGMETIPVRFWMADEDKALELALVENIQRSDLNPIEEAYGYKRLMERRGMTQSEVAQTVSKGRSTIANALRLLDLPEEAQQLLFEEKISAGHARAILSIPTVEGRKSLTNKLMNEKLSVREAEAIARLLAGRENSKKESTGRVAAPPSFKKAARSMSKILSMPVRVKTVQGKNKIEIQFKDEEELQRVVAALTEKD